MRNANRWLGAVVVLGALQVTGCGPAAQDSGDTTPSTISGVAIDGPVARALVYLDTNQNYLLDAWEPFAFADADGYFSKAKDGTDYCASAATEEHCLKGNAADGDILRIEKGYDKITGEPFVGTMSREIGGSGAMVGSPLTSLLSYMSSTEKQSFVTATSDKLDTAVAPADDGSPSVSMADLQSDLLDFANTLTDAQRAYLINLSLRAHKMADAIAAYLSQQYKAAGYQVFGDTTQLPRDATGYVYDAIAEEWLKASLNGQNGESQVIKNIVVNANQKIAVVLGVAQVTLSDTALTAVSTRMLNLVGLIDAAFDPTATYTQAQIESRMRAIEVMTGLLRDAGCLADGTCGADTGQTSKAWLAANLDNFGASMDVGAVTKALIAAVTAGNDPATAITLSNYNRTAISTTNLQGLSISSASGDSAAFTVNQDGSLDLTLTYSGANSSMASSGQVVTGSVKPLNDYALLVDLQVAGVTEPTIIQRNADGSYRFDYDGNSESWTP